SASLACSPPRVLRSHSIRLRFKAHLNVPVHWCRWYYFMDTSRRLFCSGSHAVRHSGTSGDHMTSIRAWRSGFVSAVVLLASVLAAEAPAATFSFTARRDFAIGTYSPESVAAGDFNGDGVTDLAVAAGGIKILLGNGDGTFQPPVSYTSDFNTTGISQSVAVGDFNGDGVPDLAAA